MAALLAVFGRNEVGARMGVTVYRGALRVG